MVSARADTVLLIFEHFIHLVTFSSAILVCFISFAFPLGFRADISFLCLTFEFFVILLISFGSVRFPDGFCSRFTSTFVTHFVLTSFRSRFPLTFRALVFTLSFSGCCLLPDFPGPRSPTRSLFPPPLCCVRLVSTQFPSTSGRLPLHPLTPRFRPDSGIFQDSSHDPTSITTSHLVTRSSSPLIPILVVWT